MGNLTAKVLGLVVSTLSCPYRLDKGVAIHTAFSEVPVSTSTTVV